MFKLLFVFLGLAQLVYSKYYYWEATWVKGGASPDGFNRPVIGINGQWPPPVLEADLGEKITITLNNKLGNESTSLHFHGIRQFGSNAMDGAMPATQCPIPPGSLFTYSFTVDEPGTYWYHSHSSQYPDGLRAPLIVRDSKAPWKSKVAKEFTITLSDWYHKQMPDLINSYQSTANTAGNEPVPDSILINDGGLSDYKVEPGKTYLFRVINIGAFPSFFFNIKDHDFKIVGLDGVYTNETPARTVVVGAAMRYDLLITTKNTTNENFDIVAWVDNSMFRTPFAGNPVAHATLVYSTSNPKPVLRDPATLGQTIFPPTDDTTAKPVDNQKLLAPVNKQIIFDFGFTKINGIQRAIINNVTYLPQKVPTLYTVASAPKSLKSDPRIYGVNSNSFVLNYGEVVEVVFNNRDTRGHPWHLHGHKFQVVARSASNALFNGQFYDASTATLPAIPAKRDTIGVRDGGWTVIRFKADNPGVQLVHCHIEWHIEAGLTATFIEAPDKIDANIPLDHKLACTAAGQKTIGNAAGNFLNYLDLNGANTVPSQQHYGALWEKKAWWWPFAKTKRASYFDLEEEE